jgi:hypothetical protein
MSKEQNWKYPDWIYTATYKLRSIETSKFLFPVRIDYEIITPDKNKYVPQWAIVIKVEIDAKDRISGKSMRVISSNNGVYAYRSSDVEDVAFEELHRLIEHELRECFQIQEAYGTTKIPFDPHKLDRHTSLYSYRKVKSFPNHPTMRSLLWSMTRKFLEEVGKTIVSWVYTPKALPKTLTPVPRASIISSGGEVRESK